MKTNGFVGTIVASVVCLALQAAAQAQYPAAAGPYANEGLVAGNFGYPGVAGYPDVVPEPIPDPSVGSVYINDAGTYDGFTSTTSDGMVDGFFGDICNSRRGFFGGGGIVALQADFDASTAFFVEDQTGPVTITTSEDFDYEREGAPRVWIGWQDEWGLAFRVTWFEFEDRSRTGATAPADFIFLNGITSPTVAGGMLAGGSAGDTITATSSIEYYTLDAEITQELNFENWQTTFGGGFRHAAVNQRYAAVGTASGTPVSSEIRHRFDGEGPTAFAEVRIPVLGTSDRRFIGSANLSVFALARGSILFGNAKLGAVDNNVLPAPSVDTAFLRAHDSLASGEIRVGAQVDFRPMDGRLIFIRGGWEAQWLDGVGNMSGLSPDRDLVLEGYSISAGMDW